MHRPAQNLWIQGGLRWLLIASLVTCGGEPSGESAMRPAGEGESVPALAAVEAALADSSRRALPVRLRLQAPEDLEWAEVTVAVGSTAGPLEVAFEGRAQPGESIELAVDRGVQALEWWAWSPRGGCGYQRVAVESGAGPMEQVIQLEAGPWARLRVVDAVGQPVADARWRGELDRRSLAPVEALAGPRPGEWYFKSSRRVRRLALLEDPVRGRAVADIDLRTKSALDLGDLVLSRTLRAAGRLTVAGEPLAQVELDVRPLLRGNPRGERVRLSTQADGGFAIPEVQGACAYRITLSSRADPWNLGSWDLLLGEDPSELSLEAHWVEVVAMQGALELPMENLALFAVEPEAIPNLNEPGFGFKRGLSSSRVALELGKPCLLAADVKRSDSRTETWKAQVEPGMRPGREVVALEPEHSSEEAQITIWFTSDYPMEGKERIFIDGPDPPLRTVMVAVGGEPSVMSLPPGDYDLRPKGARRSPSTFLPPELSLSLGPGDEVEVAFTVFQGVLVELDLRGPWPEGLGLGDAVDVELEHLGTEGTATPFGHLIEFHPVGRAYSEAGHNMFERTRLGSLYRCKDYVPPGQWQVTVERRDVLTERAWQWRGQVNWEPGGRPRVGVVLEPLAAKSAADD